MRPGYAYVSPSYLSKNPSFVELQSRLLHYRTDVKTHRSSVDELHNRMTSRSKHSQAEPGPRGITLTMRDKSTPQLNLSTRVGGDGGRGEAPRGSVVVLADISISWKITTLELA